MSNRNDRAKKREVAERVKEIQARQKNWFQQRDQHIKTKSENGTGIFEGKRKQENLNHEVKKDSSKQSTQLNSKVTSSHLNPSNKFKSWLHSREQKTDNLEHSSDEGNVNVLKISSSRSSGYASPESERGSGMYGYGSANSQERNKSLDALMSPQDFDALADSIVSRVKRDLSVSDLKSNTYIQETRKFSAENKPAHSKNRDTKITRTTGSSIPDTSGHMCPICHRLMIPPHNEPMISIPCGHSVCKQCCDSSVCATCQCHVTSHICNMMLKQIILDYHKKEFQPRESTKPQYTPEHYTETTSSYNKYKEEHENLLARQEVLHSELDSVKSVLSNLDRQKNKVQKQVHSITSEEDKIKGQIKSLEGKLRVLEAQREGYEQEYSEVDRKFSTENNRLNMIQDTLLSIEIQLEKVRLLAEGRR